MSKLNGNKSQDSSSYVVLTDGNGVLNVIQTISTGNVKQLNGSYAPDGSMYIVFTDGAGNLL